MTNEKIILQLEKGYDIKNPQLAKVLTNIDDKIGVTKEELVEAMETKADLVGGKVPAEQLPSYVDDVIEFENGISGNAAPADYLNAAIYTGKTYFIESANPVEGTLAAKYNYKFVDFGANTSESDWTVFDPEQGKIYVRIGEGSNKNHSYRWTGTALIDLNQEWSTKIAAIETNTSNFILGGVTDLSDLSTMATVNQEVLKKLYISLESANRLYYRLTQVSVSANGKTYVFPIFDGESSDHSFKIYNGGALQTYKVTLSGSTYALVKVNEVKNYVFLTHGEAASNMEALKPLALMETRPCVILIGGMWYYGYITKATEDDSLGIAFETTHINTFTVKNRLGTVTQDLMLNADYILNTIRLGDLSGKTNEQVNKDLADALFANYAVIQQSDLGTTITGEALTRIRNATYLLVVDASNKVKCFNRGYDLESIYWISPRTTSTIDHITLSSADRLSSIISVSFDATVFDNYRNNGGTKTTRSEWYTEMAAQFTENTYVLDSSALNTVLQTDIANAIERATTLIITNAVGNKTLVFKRGGIASTEIYFNCTDTTSGGAASFKRIIYYISTKTCSAIANVIVNPYQWYRANGGTKYADQASFTTAFIAAIDAQTGA
jgi:hypothetical protein